jgi:pimeloyl-ACP methyl ester carboxylesterase
VLRLVRTLGRLGLGLALTVGTVVLFLVLVVLTRGFAAGLGALLPALAVGLLAGWLWGRHRGGRPRVLRLLPVLVAAALTVPVCIPGVPTQRQFPADLSFVPTMHWRLSTGSRVAVYHYRPAGGATAHRTPLVYLNGGPVRSISLLDHTFLRLLARRGYDVYAYEQAGGGRSDLLPMRQYTIGREVRDLDAFLTHLHRGNADVLGFSSGAVVLTRALADPTAAAHIDRAIIAEPGPIDGPTARIHGHEGHPSARGVAPPIAGPSSIHTPRYGVAFGLMQLGLLPPDNDLITQGEGDNAFTAADLGSDTASGYCAKDAHRIPTEDTAQNFSFSAAASLQVQQTIKDSPSISTQLKRSRTPAMLMIAECSSQIRQWETTVLADDPAIQRTQYLPGVGHHMWNGLDDNNDRAANVISAFLQNAPAPLPNYPTRPDIPAFLAARS